MEKVKILKQTAAALMIAAISFTGCKKDDPVKVSGVNINKTTLTLDIGASETLTATVAPADAENKAVTWNSDKPDVATVTDGKVTAVKTGTATITVTTADGGFTATCTVTVNQAITMTTTISGEAKIYLNGSGIGAINWGDGTLPQAIVLSEILTTGYTHSFSGTSPRTITISVENITTLNCSSLKLTALDVNNSPALKILICTGNQLTSLDVAKNTALEKLNCNSNELTSIDVSNNTELIELWCENNRLTALDVTKNTALNLLWCKNNQLTAEGLNALFGTLHSNTIDVGKAIFIAGNPGAAACNQSIATAKGWTTMRN